MDGFLPVKVMVPLKDYARLYSEAQASRRTVAEVIAAALTPPEPPKRSGRPSGYTTKAGEEISAGRRFSMSWPEVADKLGVSVVTARAWLRKYENEVREQNMRDSAGRKAS